MKNGDPFRNMDSIIKEIKKLDRKNPTDPDEEEDPRVAELIAEGLKLVNELDPIVRETFRDNPAALAEWDEIMRMRDPLPEDDSAQSKLSSPKKAQGE